MARGASLGVVVSQSGWLGIDYFGFIIFTLIYQYFCGGCVFEPYRENTEKIITKLATENKDWGYKRISGEMKKLGHDVSPGTVRNIIPFFILNV